MKSRKEVKREVISRIIDLQLQGYQSFSIVMQRSYRYRVDAEWVEDGVEYGLIAVGEALRAAHVCILYPCDDYRSGMNYKDVVKVIMRAKRIAVVP